MTTLARVHGIAISLVLVTFQVAIARQPHILFILMDDLGWSDVGYHGISAIRTPNIDRLAAEGVKLMSYYSQPMCTPTRGALMTGLYPIRTGMQHFVVNATAPWGMPTNISTLPDKLRELGYNTKLVGKWHLGFFEWNHTPTYRGFDTFFGFYLGEGDHWNHTKFGYLDLRRNREPTWNYTGQHTTDIFTQETIDIVEHYNSTKPMFLLLSYAAVHTPLQAHQTDINKYNFITYENRRVYAAMMDSVDQAIGRIEEAFKKKGIWNDTLLIWASDNGAHSGRGGGCNWPLRGMKSTLWEGGVRVPAFVHGQMLKKKGINVTELMHVTDWYPTLVKLAGGTVEPKIDGVDQWGVLSDGQSSRRREILLNIDIANSHEGERYAPRGLNYYTGAAIRRDHMKLVYRCANYTWYNLPENDAQVPTDKMFVDGRLPFIDLALFNITADPEERHDIKSQHPDIVHTLMARLKYYNSTAVQNRLKPGDPRSLKLAKKLGRWEPWIDEDSTTERPVGGSTMYDSPAHVLKTLPFAVILITIFG